MLKKIIKSLYYRLKSNFTTEDLIKKGLKVGKNFNRMQDVLLDPSHCWLIQIGDDVTLAPRVNILAHDASTKLFLGVTKVGRVTIGDRVFVGSDTVILPNVTISSDVIIGSNSTVSKNLPSGYVYAGNPVKPICTLEEYLEKNKKQILSGPIYDRSFTNNGKISKAKKEKMFRELENVVGYVE